MDTDKIECAYIRLRGAAERLLMILQHRSERNYDIAMQAVEQTIMDFHLARGQEQK